MNRFLANKCSIFRGQSASPFPTEYQAVYDAFTIKPSASVANAQSTMVKSLVDSGVWAKLDVFFVLAGHTNTNGESLINWFDPGVFDATAVNSPTFTALEGFTGDGVTSYINTNWKPSTDGINFTLNNSAIGSYIRTNINSNGMIMGINDGSNDIILQISNNSPTLSIKFSDGSGADVTLSGGVPGLYVSTRPTSNSRIAYRNKTSVISDSEASVGISDKELYMLAWNNSPAGIFSNQQISLGFMSSSMSQTDVNNLTNAFEKYMDSNGKGVIS